MNGIKKGILAGMCIVLGVVLVGCDLGGEADDVTSDVTGSWLYSDTDGGQSTWALVQSDDGSVTGAGTDGETISGSISSDSIYLSLNYSSTDSTASLSGTISGSTMSGSFTNSSSGSGSWTAVQTD